MKIYSVRKYQDFRLLSSILYKNIGFPVWLRTILEEYTSPLYLEVRKYLY